MELPYPEETQIWEGKNESVRSRQFCSFCSLLPPIFNKQRLDAKVTVWLTSKKNPQSTKRGIMLTQHFPLTQHFALSETQMLTLS